LSDETNHLWDRENHLGRRRLLDDVSVEETTDRKIPWVANLARRNDARTQWAEGVEPLPSDPAVIPLQITRGDIIHAHLTPHIFEGPVGADRFRGLPVTTPSSASKSTIPLMDGNLIGKPEPTKLDGNFAKSNGYLGIGRPDSTA